MVSNNGFTDAASTLVNATGTWLITLRALRKLLNNRLLNLLTA